MAGFEEEAFRSLAKMLANTSKEAIMAAENAAAKVFLEAARSAAPSRSGDLRRSLAIIESRRKNALFVESGPNAPRRLFVGPEKKKGYYGFFVEKGHRTAGRRRIARQATSTTHSQRGVESTGMVPAHPWFEPAIRSSSATAMAAAELAFNLKLQELNSRK